MTCARRGLIVLFILAPLGLWGCAQEKNGATNTKIRDLAAKNAKLEEDHRVATTTADGLRKKLTAAETQRAELTKQVEALQDAARERDDMKKQLNSRTGERDALHAQLLQFGKELQNLAGRIEAAASTRSSTTTAAASLDPMEP